MLPALKSVCDWLNGHGIKYQYSEKVYPDPNPGVFFVLLPREPSELSIEFEVKLIPHKKGTRIWVFYHDTVKVIPHEWAMWAVTERLGPVSPKPFDHVPPIAELAALLEKVR
jgi:hypothetical protein